MNKIIKIFIGLGLCFLTIFLLFLNQPRTFKQLFGSSRSIGEPINAIVYTNGHVDTNLKVYHYNKYYNGEKTNTYLLSLKEFDKEGMLKFIILDMDWKIVGRPVGTSDDAYYKINNVLYQSEVGEHFVDFKDDMKGFNFDPKLTFTNKEIKFNIPPGELKFDSIRISLK